MNCPECNSVNLKMLCALCDTLCVIPCAWKAYLAGALFLHADDAD
jgi:hypothetical protein